MYLTHDNRKCLNKLAKNHLHASKTKEPATTADSFRRELIIHSTYWPDYSGTKIIITLSMRKLNCF